jgi:hypothetical protein
MAGGKTASLDKLSRQRHTAANPTNAHPTGLNRVLFAFDLISLEKFIFCFKSAAKLILFYLLRLRKKEMNRKKAEITVIPLAEINP